MQTDIKKSATGLGGNLSMAFRNRCNSAGGIDGVGTAGCYIFSHPITSNPIAGLTACISINLSPSGVGWISSKKASRSRDRKRGHTVRCVGSADTEHQLNRSKQWFQCRPTVIHGEYSLRTRLRHGDARHNAGRVIFGSPTLHWRRGIIAQRTASS